MRGRPRGYLCGGGYVGAHYPHDVIGAALLALPVAYLAACSWAASPPPLVARLRTGVLHPVLSAAPAGPTPLEGP